MGLEEFKRLAEFKKHVEDVNNLFEDKIYKNIKEYYRKIANENQDKSVANSAADEVRKISFMELVYTSMLNDLNNNPYNLCIDDTDEDNDKLNILINDANNGLQLLNQIIINNREGGYTGAALEKFAGKLKPLYIGENSLRKKFLYATVDLNNMKKRYPNTVISFEEDNDYIAKRKAMEQSEKNSNVDYNKPDDGYEEIHEVSRFPRFDDDGNIGNILEENGIVVNEPNSEHNNANVDALHEAKMTEPEAKAIPAGYPVDINTQGAFKKNIDRLKAAKTGYNSSEYKNIIKYLDSIDTESRPYDNTLEGYAAKLIKTREYIDKYIGHKVKSGVNQNAYKKLAAVEELSQEIDKRMEDLLTFAKVNKKQKVEDALVARNKNSKPRYAHQLVDTIMKEDLDKKCLEAKDKGIAQEDIEDLKFTDYCMVAIIVRAYNDERSDKTIDSLEEMRKKFQNYPSNVATDVASFNTNGAFQKNINRLEVAKTGDNKDAYNKLIDYLNVINTEQNPSGNTLEGYAAKLIMARELIDNYIGEKADKGVEQNEYKALAAVEELSRAVDKRINYLIPFAGENKKQQLEDVLKDRRDRSLASYKAQGLASSSIYTLVKDKLDKLSSAAKDKGFAQEDIEDIKFTDRCMKAIIIRAHDDKRSKEIIRSLEDMREKFQNNPSNCVVEAPKANAEVKNVEPQTPSI